MLEKEFFSGLRNDYGAADKERRVIIGASNPLLHDSKRAIFAIHRGDRDGAAAALEAIENELKRLEGEFGFARLNQEGAYRAAVEEYVEAAMYLRVVTGKPIAAIDGIRIAHDNYLAGLCDLTGELVRAAVNAASAGKDEMAHEYKAMIGDIMAELVEFDLTGYIRTKYDQAKTNLKKIEHIIYELSLRGR